MSFSPFFEKNNDYKVFLGVNFFWAFWKELVQMLSNYFLIFEKEIFWHIYHTSINTLVIDPVSIFKSFSRDTGKYNVILYELLELENSLGTYN